MAYTGFYQGMKRSLVAMPTLQKLRELAVLTQAELAEKVEVSATTISHWETGSKRPRASNIRKLAEALGVSPQDILVAIQETLSDRE
jgi:transcriptional regulator with XRE-family HTH domain